MPIRAIRFASMTMWLAMPWRVVAPWVFGVALATFGCRRALRIGPVVMAGAVVAVVQAVHRGQVATALVVSMVSMCAIACPLADAWVSRRSAAGSPQRYPRR